MRNPLSRISAAWACSHPTTTPSLSATQQRSFGEVAESLQTLRHFCGGDDITEFSAKVRDRRSVSWIREA